MADYTPKNMSVEVRAIGTYEGTPFDFAFDCPCFVYLRASEETLNYSMEYSYSEYSCDNELLSELSNHLNGAIIPIDVDYQYLIYRLRKDALYLPETMKKYFLLLSSFFAGYCETDWEEGTIKVDCNKASANLINIIFRLFRNIDEAPAVAISTVVLCQAGVSEVMSLLFSGFMRIDTDWNINIAPEYQCWDTGHTNIYMLPVKEDFHKLMTWRDRVSSPFNECKEGYSDAEQWFSGRNNIFHSSREAPILISERTDRELLNTILQYEKELIQSCNEEIEVGAHYA